MALSDVCSEFNDDLVTAAQRLAARIEEYASPPYDYEKREIRTLRSACAEVIAAAEPNWDFIRLRRAVMRLMGLAQYTTNRHDAGPNLPPYDPPAEA
jgi:hypothetical protein